MATAALPDMLEIEDVTKEKLELHIWLVSFLCRKSTNAK
jgi:hypothetical protein